MIFLRFKKMPKSQIIKNIMLDSNVSHSKPLVLENSMTSCICFARICSNAVFQW